MLTLAPPQWHDLLGGNEEANWLASRDRRFGLAMPLATEALVVEQQLRARDALLHCTPDVLREIPDAAFWYCKLLQLSSKMIDNSTERTKSFGLALSPAAVIAALERGQGISQAEVEAFSRWINAEIIHLFPQLDQDTDQDRAHRNDLASASALMAYGLLAHGRSQNLGGDVGVVILKTSLVDAMAGHHPIETERSASWIEYSPEHNLPSCRRLRFGNRLVCDFTPGGNRPDIIIVLDGVIVAVGEIKSRIDLSNVWESWMPQVADHMRTWAQEYPSAARLFFGTVVTEGMVLGESLKGTRHVGLRELYEEGALTSAYNLANLVAREATALAHFGDLTTALEALIATGTP